MAWELRTRRGEEAPNALSSGVVREIREKYANGGTTMQQIANEYGVTKMAVSLIVRGLRHTDS